MNQEIAEALVNWEDHDDIDFFEVVKDEEIIDKTRWNIHLKSIYKDKRDDSYWAIHWSRGATEYQDSGVEDISFYQVVPVQKTITVYEPLVK